MGKLVVFKRPSKRGRPRKVVPTFKVLQLQPPAPSKANGTKGAKQ